MKVVSAIAPCGCRGTSVTSNVMKQHLDMLHGNILLIFCLYFARSANVLCVVNTQTNKLLIPALENM